MKVDWRHYLGGVVILIGVAFGVYKITLGSDPSIPTESAPAGGTPMTRAADEPDLPHPGH